MLNDSQEHRPVSAGQLRPGPSGRVASQPGGAGRRNPVAPDTVPSGRASTAPSGRPSTVPSGRASTAPSGRPSTAHSGGAGAADRDRSAWIALVALPLADAVGLTVAGVIAGRGPAAALYGLAAFGALWLAGLHRPRISLRVSDQVGRILVAVVLPMLLLLPVLSVPQAARLVLLSAGLVVGLRLVTVAGLRTARRRGRLAEPALVVGSGTFGAHLAGQIRQHPELGLRVAGFLDDGSPRRDLPEPVLGGPADLAAVVGRLGIRRVIVCFGDWRDEDLVPALRACHGLPADVCVVPRLYELGLAVPRGCLDEIWGIPLIPLRRGPGRAQAGLKRAFDIGVAAILLAIALPALLVLAAVTRLQTGQPPLFRQRRLTGEGREAAVLKLRTVTAAGDPQTSWTPGSGRITRLGNLLRATHLDELPQLVNVLRGDMSLVGPRPERAYFAERFAREIPRYRDRDRMRAGLTGWAQVHGLHGDTSIAERVRFDNTYIEYWSPWLDLTILARTLGSALAGLGAGR
jgi:exopolysaccharide biosynthesis polyprenyl glycosylphosphotransferase